MRCILLTCVATGFLLAGCAGPSANSGITKGAERSGGLFGMVKQDAVKVETADAFKGVNQVIIGAFSVGFATYKTDSAKAGGGLTGSGFGGKSTAKSTLIGIDDATMQAITDTAYKGFVADLQAKGYTVVDRASLAGDPDFAKTKTYPNPYEDSSGGLFGTSSKTKYFAPSSFGGLKVFMGDIAGLTGGFGFDNPSISASQFAKSKGIKVLNVSYVLDFANAESYGNWATTTSNVNVGQGMTIIPEYTKIGLIGGDGGTFQSSNGFVRLGQPLTSNKEFATVKDSTSDTYKGVEVATNVIGLLGGVGTNKSREFDFTARPDAYKAAALDVIKQANDTMIGKMASVR
jgi:hypothetical protein